MSERPRPKPLVLNSRNSPRVMEALLAVKARKGENYTQLVVLLACGANLVRNLEREYGVAGEALRHVRDFHCHTLMMAGRHLIGDDDKLLDQALDDALMIDNLAIEDAKALR